METDDCRSHASGRLETGETHSGMGQRSHTTTTEGGVQEGSERDGLYALQGQRGKLHGFFERQTKEERERTTTRDFRGYARKVKKDKRKAGRERRRRRQEQHK
jgi:hypothetical protein